MSSGGNSQEPVQESQETPTWTYPTRFCRICREDVAPTVTMYPPGVPPRFQRPMVEYKNEDEYGRLVKPCKCSGSMRYIHELCLLRSRTENRREGSMWRCHTCGYKFNFQKLAMQRFLSSRYSSGTLTVVFMLLLMFFLGFIADPIINLYVDPYETLLGDQDVWDEVRMRTPVPGLIASWGQHFVKGMISMGLMGFLKTMLLNPLNWLNLRQNLGLTSARTTQTGRDRAISISWVAVLIGIVSAFYFFYQWVQTVIQMTLKKIGNNIVDTQLPNDDDDLKPPPGWKRGSDHDSTTDSSGDTTARSSENPADTFFDRANGFMGQAKSSEPPPATSSPMDPAVAEEPDQPSPDNSLSSSYVLAGSWPSDAFDMGRSSALDTAHDQGWSFTGI